MVSVKLTLTGDTSKKDYNTEINVGMEVEKVHGNLSKVFRNVLRSVRKSQCQCLRYSSVKQFQSVVI